MATTPHSSWNLSEPNLSDRNLSNMRFECPLVSGPQCRDVPGTQRIAALPDLHPLLNCSAPHRSLDTIPIGNRRHLFCVGGGNQDAGRSFVEGQNLGAQVA